MGQIIVLSADQAAWIALAPLVVVEAALGMDSLIFISILTRKLPAHQQARARIGVGLALIVCLGSGEQSVSSFV